MTWRTHVAGGVAALWALYPALARTGGPSGPASGPGPSDLSNLGILAAVAALGALLPDLDARGSRLARLELPGGVAPFAPAARAINRTLGHRGPLHSLAGLVMVALLIALPLAWWAGAYAGAALLLGFASHLLLDACTKTGVPLLWPDRRRRSPLSPARRIATGSPAEDAVFALLAVAAMALLLAALRPEYAPAASAYLVAVSR